MIVQERFPYRQTINPYPQFIPSRNGFNNARFKEAAMVTYKTPPVFRITYNDFFEFNCKKRAHHNIAENRNSFCFYL